MIDFVLVISPWNVSCVALMSAVSFKVPLQPHRNTAVPSSPHYGNDTFSATGSAVGSRLLHKRLDIARDGPGEEGPLRCARLVVRSDPHVDVTWTAHFYAVWCVFYVGAAQVLPEQPATTSGRVL